VGYRLKFLPLALSGWPAGPGGEGERPARARGGGRGRMGRLPASTHSGGLPQREGLCWSSGWEWGGGVGRERSRPAIGAGAMLLPAMVFSGTRGGGYKRCTLGKDPREGGGGGGGREGGKAGGGGTGGCERSGCGRALG